jgi:hypothetical protein
MIKGSAILGLLMTVSLTSVTARASTIFDVTSSLTLADPTQTGRLSRNGVAQDWSGGELFPGVLNTATTYRYQTYSVNVGSRSFIQIDFDSISTNTFVSAYDTSYVPNSAGTPNFGFDTHWLGDAGVSGNFFGTDPLFFQVVEPANRNLVLVINNTTAGNVGVGDSFHLTVEGFFDSNFSDAPEPSAVVLFGGGLILLALGSRARLQRSTKIPF